MAGCTLRGGLAAAAAVGLLAFAGTSSAADRDAVVAQLTRLSDAWDEAIVRKDESAVAANMADDFRIIDANASIHDKRAFVAEIVDPKLVIDPYTVDDFEVRVYGDVALLSGRTHMTGRYDDKPFESNYRYIDIYARRGGAWKIVSVQITKIPPAGAGS